MFVTDVGAQMYWWKQYNVDGNDTMLMTVLAIFVTNIDYLIKSSSSIIIQKMSPISKFCHDV